MVECAGRDKLGVEVLNDRWVSIPQGSEHFQFKTKIQYEEDLYKIEDQRYFYDQTLNCNQEVIDLLERLKGPASRNAYSKLSQFQLKWIYHIYGGPSTQKGSTSNSIVESIREAPEEAIPIILARLKSKQNHFIQKKSQLEVEWREQCEKKWSKSLDHQSYSFKQREK